MKKVSIAMAVYNGERYIREQIDSIVKQLGENDELVISYDKSTDSTLDIIREYESKYPQVKVCIDPGSGVFSNFENAVRNCSGDIIFISDQDDIWADDKIRKISERFEKSGADMVIHNGVHIDGDGNVITQDFFSMYGIGKGVLKNFAKPRYSGCCTAFNKKMKDLIIPIPRKVGAYDHWIGMIGELFGKLEFDPEILIYHRLHGNNVTVSKRKAGVILASRWNIITGLLKLAAGNRRGRRGNRK